MSNNNFSLSRVEQILKAALTDTEYGKVPQSRVEYLLLELIKKGRGGSAGGYVPSGNAYFDDLPTPSKDYLGYVYNMVEDFTTTADFLEGAGKTYPAGSNVAVVDAGSADNPKYMFDVLAGFIDLSDYVQKEQGKGLSTNDYTDEDKQSLDNIQSVIPSTATPQNPLATTADVTIPSTSTTSPITDSADGMVQELTIYGKSEVVDGEIKSVGDNGLTVTTANSDNTLTTFAEFATALPLRSTLDEAMRDELIIGSGKAEVITRCEVVDDNIVPLAEPITTPLTSTEISAFRGLKTYDNTTNITITDSPDFEIDYLKNAENGQAVADIQRNLQGQIDKITVELTQAEYDALTEEEKNNGTIYFITDAPSGITIDNELSATSTNAVQNRVITSQVNKILSEAEIQAQINDRIYQGTDLTVKFADEISASPYNGDPWAWIKARIQAENFTGIHVGDYIPFTTTNGVTFNAQIAGINTYKYYGGRAVGSHIDFICKELWPTRYPVNKVNYNNGTSAQNHPWLASDLYLYLNSLSGDVPNGTSLNPETVAVDYTADGVYYFLPTQLKNVIIEKQFLLPTRYSASGLLTDDNSCAWKNIGKLWLPDECEVYGMPVWGGKGSYSLGGSALQYPLFAGNMNRLKFRNGGRDNWWLLSPYSGYSTYWCLVGSSGGCAGSNTSNSGIAAPVCFRVG